MTTRRLSLTLLLDEDLAARSASLAGLIRLGFEQLAWWRVGNR